MHDKRTQGAYCAGTVSGARARRTGLCGGLVFADEDGFKGVVILEAYGFGECVSITMPKG